MNSRLSAAARDPTPRGSVAKFSTPLAKKMIKVAQDMGYLPRVDFFRDVIFIKVRSDLGVWWSDMAISVEDLIQMRDDLIRNRTKGGCVLNVAGELVESQPFADMNRALADFVARIARASGTTRSCAIRFHTNNGC